MPHVVENGELADEIDAAVCERQRRAVASHEILLGDPLRVAANPQRLHGLDALHHHARKALLEEAHGATRPCTDVKYALYAVHLDERTKHVQGDDMLTFGVRCVICARRRFVVFALQVGRLGHAQSRSCRSCRARHGHACVREYSTCPRASCDSIAPSSVRSVAAASCGLETTCTRSG